MQLKPFQLERYFAAYEFSVEQMLSASDCESLSLAELLALADSDSRRMWDELRLGYTESQGHPALRSQIAAHYTSIRAADVLTAVPEEAIFIAMNVLLQPGEHVVVIQPAYQSLSEVARAIGCRVTSWPLLHSGARWQLDLDALAAALSGPTRLVVVNFPHNPTGCLPSLAEWQALVELCAARGVYLFSDEMYRGLELTGAAPLPAACDLYERALSLAGLSKAWGLPGLRVGWLACRDAELLEQMARFKDYTTICASAPAEALALMALRASPTILARNLELVRANVRLTAGFMAAHAGRLRWTPPEGGSVAVGHLDGATAIERFCLGLVEQQRTMLLPGSVFDLPGNAFRLGLGRAPFGQALDRLGVYLQEGN